MKYMLLIYGDEAAIGHATPEQAQAVSDEYDVFTKSIVASGQFLDGDPFLPTGTATTVSMGNGSAESEKGPAVTTDPQLIAYYKVEAADEAAAIELARRVPGAKYGSVEVRQVIAYD